jgi:hypothetical protein
MTPTKLMVRQAEVDAGYLAVEAARALYEVELQAKAADARKRAHGPRAAFRRSMPSTLRDGSIYVVGTAKPLVRNRRGGGDPVESVRGVIWAASRLLPATSPVFP